MIIGLTGGIASGKSTVSKYLEKKGFKIFDADKIAKKISEKKYIQKEIILAFGNNILDENKNIDRKKLKKIVFENKNNLKKLNEIIHPKVFNFYKRLKEKNKSEILIFDVPLLFESGINKLCDKILVIISDYETQIARIIQRDKINRELADKIIKSQITNEDRIKKANEVIENNGTLEELIKKIERFCEKI